MKCAELCSKFIVLFATLFLVGMKLVFAEDMVIRDVYSLVIVDARGQMTPFLSANETSGILSEMKEEVISEFEFDANSTKKYPLKQHNVDCTIIKGGKTFAGSNGAKIRKALCTIVIDVAHNEDPS